MTTIRPSVSIDERALLGRVTKQTLGVTWFIVSFGLRAKILASSGHKTEVLASLAGLEANFLTSAILGRHQNFTYCTLLFGRPFVKRFALCYWSVVCPVCLSVCPVCIVRALWPSGWTDQDETWYAGRPRPWPHCVRWGPSYPASPSPKGHSPQFWPHVCCSQMASWITMSLGMKLGLG